VIMVMVKFKVISEHIIIDQVDKHWLVNGYLYSGDNDLIFL